MTCMTREYFHATKQFRCEQWSTGPSLEAEVSEKYSQAYRSLDWTIEGHENIDRNKFSALAKQLKQKIPQLKSSGKISQKWHQGISL